MIVAYSRLQKILEEKRLSVPELHRRLQQQDQGVNILRVAGAICQLCDVTLADLVDFSGQGAKLAALAADKQDRLDRLMEKNNQGELSRKEQRELQDLVRETQELTLHNAKYVPEAGASTVARPRPPVVIASTWSTSSRRSRVVPTTSRIARSPVRPATWQKAIGRWASIQRRRRRWFCLTHETTRGKSIFVGRMTRR